MALAFSGQGFACSQGSSSSINTGVRISHARRSNIALSNLNKYFKQT